MSNEFKNCSVIISIMVSFYCRILSEHHHITVDGITAEDSKTKERTRDESAEMQREMKRYKYGVINTLAEPNNFQVCVTPPLCNVNDNKENKTPTISRDMRRDEQRRNEEEE